MTQAPWDYPTKYFVEHRLRRRVSLIDMAWLLDLDEDYVASVEAGEVLPTVDELKDWHRALGMKMGELFHSPLVDVVETKPRLLSDIANEWFERFGPRPVSPA